MKRLIFVCLTLLTACQKKDGLPDYKPDTEAPQIQLLGPDKADMLQIGSTFGLRLRLTDDRKLSQCRWWIACDVDTTGFDALGRPFFRTEENIDLSGTEFHVARSVSIPDSISPGPYILHIQCLDAANHLTELHFP